MTTSSPIPPLLARLTTDPGRPRLTWYGPDDERIEVSGAVLDNWVTKTANLLAEEYECGPGTRVVVDLPAHWRTVVWALAVWRTGACVVLPDEPGATDAVVVTHRPGAWPARDVVAVALPGLARSFDGDLPPGATDAAAAVMTYGDVLTWMPEAEPGAAALATGEERVALGDLVTWARDRVPHSWPAAPWWDEALAGRPARVLLEAPDDDVAALLAAVLATLDAEGSVVLCAPPVTAVLATDPERRQRLLATEHVTD